MIEICSINFDDNSEGQEIMISAEPAEYEGITGFRLVASNGDPVGNYLPKSLETVRQEAIDSWSAWKTFKLRVTNE